MFSAGIGQMDAAHAVKGDPARGMWVVKVSRCRGVARLLLLLLLLADVGWCRLVLLLILLLFLLLFLLLLLLLSFVTRGGSRVASAVIAVV